MHSGFASESRMDLRLPPAIAQTAWHAILLRNLGVVVFAGMVILSPAGLCAQVGLSVQEQQLFDLANQERTKANLPKFRWNYHLAEVARAHAQLMVQHSQLSYGFPKEPSLLERIARSGARFNAAAENVAAASTAAEIHRTLMESPSLRGNILNSRFNEAAFATLNLAGTIYVTQDFAHILPPYTEIQFRQAVIEAFNQARRERGFSPIDVRADPRLEKAACATSHDPDKVLASLPGATDLVMYSASEPQRIPTHMREAAGDRTLLRMNIGVCFPSHGKTGYSKFWVVASFYPFN